MLLLLLLFILIRRSPCATEPRKEKVVGTWSICKREKLRRIWKPCERTSCVRQRALLSVCFHFLYFGLQSDCERFTNLFDVPQPLPVFSSRAAIFFARSLKGTGYECFDWLIIPLQLPIPFTLFSLDRNSSDSASDSSF